jgi:2,3-bisphosphoglycerate-dependent phosphoglycerate mutase
MSAVPTRREGFEQRPFRPPAGSTEIVLVRHGASEAAVEGRFFPSVDGHSDPALSEPGRVQAAAVAARLHREQRFEQIFVSNLRRTRETAEPLCRLSGVEPRQVDDLREVFLGEFEGGVGRVRAAQGDPLAKRIYVEERWDVVPGAESLDDLGTRLHGAIADIVAVAGPDAAVVAFVHGAVIGQLCRMAVDSRPFAFVHSDNGSISRIVVLSDGRWTLHSFNDVAHLTPALV